MPYSISTHLVYNTWANEQFVNMLEQVPLDVYQRDTGGSFSSIAKTVIHIWGAQDIWVKRMMGTSPGTWPVNEYVEDRDFTLQGLVDSSAALQALANSKSAEALDELYTYQSLKGEKFESRYIDTLYHVVNHSSYHRGQLVTLLRQAGFNNIIGTDLIHYLRTR